jgi:thiol-disulfide isomerase/thioredoxin
METFIKKIHQILLCLLLLTTFNATAAYDLSLKSPDDNEHKLSEYIGKGQWVVLNIWGTRCPPCLEEMPELVQFHDENKDKKAIVVGIAIDFPSYGYAKKKQVADFVDDYLIDFPVLLSDASITQKLGLGVLQALPTTYLFTPNGTVVGMQIGAITKEIIENFIQQYENKNKRAK